MENSSLKLFREVFCSSARSRIAFLRITLFILIIINFINKSFAQTSVDGLMMGPGKFCNVLTYSHDKWDHYWEGKLRRENLNIGSVTTQNVMYMGALGIVKDLNVLVGIPYVWTKASAGTLKGQNGIQDLMLDVKWRPLRVNVPLGRFSVMGVLGFSTPLSNYTPDFLPMSIGLHSTTGSVRGILHYQTNMGFFATVQGGYIRRSNIKIDRNSYYTDKQYNTNEVVVPDAISFSPRIGYTKPNIIAEIWYDNFYSLDGNDIRRNDMPFPANAMRAEKVGVFALYRFKFLPGFGLTGAASYTTYGRNVGQSTSYTAGFTYVFSAWSDKKKAVDTSVDTIK
jgi:hypothetical protein